jgi:hypothetical protein
MDVHCTFLDAPLLRNHLSNLTILSPETRAMKEALRGVGFQETHPMAQTMHPSILPILSPETRAMKEALRGVGFQEKHPMPRPPNHQSILPTYSIPRDKGYKRGVESGGVPGDTPHALNNLSILPILSPETRAMKESL